MSYLEISDGYMKNCLSKRLFFALFFNVAAPYSCFLFSDNNQLKNKIAPRLVFHKSRKTLEKVREIISKKEKGIYLRFGDGEINVAIGKDHRIQKNSKKLQNEMREAIGLNGPTVMKSLPLNCKEFGGYEEGMFPGNHEWSFHRCVDFLNKVKPLWKQDITDVYSQVALHFSATYNPNYCVRFLKFLRDSNCCVFVGNSNIPSKMRELLFGQHCKFIPVPSQQVYGQIDRIERECLEKISNGDEYKVVVIAMGCTGNILQKRLWRKLDNVFLFNFGSLIDALCGLDSRAWIKLSKFNAEKFLKLLSNEVRVICTAALISQQFEERKHEYIHSLDVLTELGYEPFIIEACKNGGPTFLEEFSRNVCYSKVNNPKLKNKGVNEARSLLAGLNHFNFSEDDIVIKLTGRYHFTSENFIRIVESSPEVDGIFRKPGKSGQVFTGCFALRHKYFVKMLKQLNFDLMERKMTNLEREVAEYVRKIEKEGAKILYLDQLGVMANTFGQGNHKPNLFLW